MFLLFNITLFGYIDASLITPDVIEVDSEDHGSAAFRCSVPILHKWSLNGHPLNAISSILELPNIGSQTPGDYICEGRDWNDDSIIYGMGKLIVKCMLYKFTMYVLVK